MEGFLWRIGTAERSGTLRNYRFPCWKAPTSQEFLSYLEQRSVLSIFSSSAY